MKKLIHSVKSIFFFLSAMCVAVLFSACDLYEATPADFLIDYGTVIHVKSAEITPTSGNYIMQGGCAVVPQGGVTITYHLENPGDYDILGAPNVDVPALVTYPANSVLNGAIASFSVVDNSTITLTVSGYDTADGDITQNNISPTIWIYRDEDNRPQSSYTVNMRCNSPPGEIKNGAGQMYSDSSNNIKDRLVLAVDLPSPLAADDTLLTVKVGGTTKYFEKNAGAFSASRDGKWNVVTTKPTGTGPTYTGGTVASTNCYIVTDIDNITTKDAYQCTVTLTDEGGLSSSHSFVSHQRKTKTPTPNTEETVLNLEDKSAFEYILTSDTGATITYTVKNTDTNTTTTATATSPAKIELAAGTYDISATATKEGYLDSEEFTATGIQVKSSVVYIAEVNPISGGSNGDDTSGNGTKLKPYATLAKATASVTEAITVFVLSDMSIDDENDLKNNAPATVLVTVKGCKGGNKGSSVSLSTNSKNFTVAGQMAVENINFTRLASSTNEDPAISVTNGELTLKNVTVEGIKSDKGAVYVKNGILRIDSKVKIKDNTNTTNELCNVYLSAMNFLGIGDLSGTSIGITTETTPTISTSLMFTNGYNEGKYGAPSKYFSSDKGYVVSLDNIFGEGALFYTGGSGSVDINNPATIKFTATTIMGARGEEVTLKAELADGTDVTDKITNWNIKVFKGAVDTNTTLKPGNGSTTIFIPTGFEPGVYKLYVTGTYTVNNKEYSDEIICTKH